MWVVATVLVVAPVSLAAFRFVQEYTAPPYDPKAMPLFREVIGSGERKVVMIHGLTGSSQFWRSRLDGFSKSHKILLVDLLGFGASPKPNAEYSLATHTSAVVRAMKDEGFYDSSTTIVGHSLGAIIAASILASESTEHFRAVLMSLPLYKDKQDAESHLSSVSAMHKGMIENSPLLRVSCYFMDVFRLPIFLFFSKVPFDVHWDVFSHSWSSLSRTLRAAIVEVNIPDLLERASRTHKIILLHNSDDEIAPEQNVSEFVEGHPSVKLMLMGSGGHNGFLRTPSAYTQKIEEFEINQ